MQKITIPGGSLEYVEMGEGAPLIMLHGGTGNVEEWGSCIDYFATKYRVIAYNRRGYGNSTPRDTIPLEFFEEDIEDLVAFLDVLGITGSVLFCAFSDGGTITLMFASRFPERTRAVVCAGAHIYVEDKTVRGLINTRRAFEQNIQKKGMEHTAQNRFYLAWFDRWLDPAFKNWSIEKEISVIKCPTLIVQGTEDEYAEMSHAERIAEDIRNSELWLAKGAHHLVHRGRQADAFKERVMAFLADK